MCSLCAWKARQPSQSHADARGREMQRWKALPALCLPLGEERRAGEDESSQRAHSDAKSEAEARAPVRHSIQCPWTPCTAGTGRLLRLQFTIPPSGSGSSGLPADAILIPAAVLHPHTSLSYSEMPQLFATAWHSLLSISLYTMLSLITQSSAGPGQA